MEPFSAMLCLDPKHAKPDVDNGAIVEKLGIVHCNVTMDERESTINKGVAVRPPTFDPCA